jgi:hypothetical protein
MSFKNNYMRNIKKLYGFINDHLIIFVSFIIYILFHSFFEKIISKYLVDTFFSYLNPSIINDFIFFVLCLLIFIQLILKKKPSKKSILISLLLLLIVIYYRCFSECWNFTALLWISEIKYVDVIILFLSLNFIFGIIYSFCDEPQYSFDASKGFCFDNPAKNDLLNRDDLAKSVAQKIINTANNESSFAIGIVSEWGHGKTTFIDFITKHLKNDNERIIIKFNPWLNNDEKSIVYSFFDLLSNKLRIQNKELSLDLEKYSEMLNATTVGGLIKFGKDIFSISNNNDLKQQFDKINKSIKSLGIQIVITIDDVDRLFENEILEVLRLIRNSANFSNTVFIVAYDRNYLITSLKKKNEHRSHFYLEKIFQAEIVLPNFEQDVIINKIKETIPRYISKTDKKKFASIINNISSNHIFDAKKFAYNNVLSNLRDVNRFINSFVISYKELEGECELIDLLNIELLRTKYLGVYELLAKEYKNFFTERNIRYETYYMTLKRVEDVEHDKNKTIFFEEHLKKDDNFTKVGLEKDQIKTIIDFIHNIFPEKEYYDYDDAELSMVSISHPMGIGRYFHYGLLKTNLSLKEFNDFRIKPCDEFCKKIEDWVKKGLEDELFKKFKETCFFYNRNDFENIIKGIFYFASLDTENKNTNSIFLEIGFEPKNLLQKLDCKNVISKYGYDEEEYKKFILDVFEKQSKPSWIVRLVSHILTYNYNIHEKILFNNEQLKDIRKEYFKRHIENTKKIDNITFVLFKDCYNHQELVKEGEEDDEIIYLEKRNKDEEAKEILKKYILKFPVSYLKALLRPNPHVFVKKMYRIDSDDVTFLWGSWDSFEEFLNTIPQSEEIEKFKEFYLLFKDANNDFVEFDFKIFSPNI